MYRSQVKPQPDMRLINHLLLWYLDFYFVLDRIFVYCVYATNLFFSFCPLRHRLPLASPLRCPHHRLSLLSAPRGSFTKVVHLLTTSGITHTAQQRGLTVMAVELALLRFSSLDCLCFIASAAGCKSFVMQSLTLALRTLCPIIWLYLSRCLR